MLTADAAVFPNNAVDLISARMDLFDSDLVVLRRPLRNTDPVQCCGVFGTLWSPDNDSYEIIGSLSGPSQPTIQRYTLGVQALVRDMDEERGLKVHSVLAKMIRSMLYVDEPLRYGLSQLSAMMNGHTETLKRWGLNQTRYLNNEISGEWLYLSTTEVWLETETR